MRFTPRLALVAIALSAAAIFTAFRSRDAEPQTVTIIEDSEPGRRLEITGRLLDYAGRPLARAAVLAYNADAQGLYNPRNSETRTPRIRGVAVTDEHGRFRFRTVWPGAYPNDVAPAHIHLQAAAPAHHTKYWEVWFEGDRFITDRLRKEARDTFILAPKPAGENTWSFEIELQLDGN